MFHDFIETSVTPNGERKYGKHPTQKPEGLIQHFVEILSIKRHCTRSLYGQRYNGSSCEKEPTATLLELNWMRTTSKLLRKGFRRRDDEAKGNRFICRGWRFVSWI